MVYVYSSLLQYEQSSGSINGDWSTIFFTNESPFVDGKNGNYRLKPDSWCINRGTYVGFQRDMAGNLPQGTCDIGAFEYVP
ncbi:MAG: choice-of-anchor Q domain-containing protein [bacterium]